jgi:hypothetical protein
VKKDEKKDEGFTGPVADNDRFTGPVADNDRAIPDEELDAAVETQAAETAGAQQAAMGAAAPVAPEGLSPERVNVLGETIIGAMEQLTGGQVSEMPESIEAPVEQLPPRLFAQLMAMEGIFETIPSAQGYQFDVEAAASSDEGLADAIAAISKAGRDKNVRRELSSMAGQAPQAEEPAEPTKEEDLSGYV